MRYSDGSYDMPECRQRMMPAHMRRHFDETVEEVELGFRVADYWLTCLEDGRDVVHFAGLAQLEAMFRY